MCIGHEHSVTLCQGFRAWLAGAGVSTDCVETGYGAIYRAELAWPDSCRTVSACRFRLCFWPLLGYLIGRVRSGAVSLNQTSL